MTEQYPCAATPTAARPKDARQGVSSTRRDGDSETIDERERPEAQGAPDARGTRRARQTGPRVGSPEQSRRLVARARPSRPGRDLGRAGGVARPGAGPHPERPDARVAVHLL